MDNYPRKNQMWENRCSRWGFVLIFSCEKIIYRIHDEHNQQRTPDMNFPNNSEEFPTHRMTSCTLCVNLRSPTAQSLPGLRKYAWRASATAQCCLPSIFCLLSSLSLLTSPSSSSLCNPASTDSPSEIEFSYFRIDFLRVVRMCPTWFPNDPQASSYSLLADESTTKIISLINGLD